MIYGLLNPEQLKRLAATADENRVPHAELLTLVDKELERRHLLHQLPETWLRPDGTEMVAKIVIIPKTPSHLRTCLHVMSDHEGDYMPRLIGGIEWGEDASIPMRIYPIARNSRKDAYKLVAAIPAKLPLAMDKFEADLPVFRAFPKRLKRYELTQKDAMDLLGEASRTSAGSAGCLLGAYAKGTAQSTRPKRSLLHYVIKELPPRS